MRPGPDWKDSNQKDKHHGTVTKVHTQGGYYSTSTSVKVEWDDVSFGSVRYSWGPTYPIELVPQEKPAIHPLPDDPQEQLFLDAAEDS